MTVLHKIVRASELPARDGVGASCVAVPAGTWRTLAEFLYQRFPAITPADWQARMLRGEVINDTGNPISVTCPFRAHAKIYYYRSLQQEAPIPFEAQVLYRDAFLVAADKPHFLPVTPAGGYLQETLLVRLKRSLGIDTLAPMHRIDRDTAGVVLFTIQPSTRDRYQGLFRERAVHKHYEAIAPWRPELKFPLEYSSRLDESPAFMQMQEIVGAPNAVTRIALLEVRGALARYSLQPSTGQKHQLRVHMASLGMPIVNDRIYPDLQPAPSSGQVRDYNNPLQLLARSLAFTDPITGEERFFESRHRLQI